jgi:hypothetical protein
MTIILNNTEIKLPSSLHEFTLGQRIEFQRQYGDLLDQMQHSIVEMEDGTEKEIEKVQYHFEKMFRVFAFFTNSTFEAVRDSEMIDQVANIYYEHMAPLFDEDDPKELQTEFSFNNETWVLASPELKHGDTMSFGEVIDSKQRIKDLSEIGASKCDYLLPLCAIYLRKKGEEYQEQFLYEGSERQQLMKTLPMDIALQVGFFLKRSMNTSARTTMSLKRARRREPVSM